MIFKRIAVGLLAVAGLLGLSTGVSWSSTGYSKPVRLVCTTKLIHHPENAPSVWAYDNYVRTTTLVGSHGSWRVSFTDNGSFTTVKGATSDSHDAILAVVTGSLHGSGSFALIKTDAKPSCGPKSYVGSSAPSTSSWAAHFFGDVSVSLNEDWKWDYRTCREHMIETNAGVSGHVKGLPCWHKPPHHKPCPTASATPLHTSRYGYRKPCPPVTSTPTPTPTPTTPVPTPTETTPPGEAPAPTPVNSDLPVTG